VAKDDKSKQRIVRHSPSTGADSPHVWGLYEPDTGSIQYVCADPATKKAAIIDAVWNFKPTNFATSTESIDQILGLLQNEGLEAAWILDTHPHADHLMASTMLKRHTGAPNAIGAKVAQIADLWRVYYNLPDAFDVNRDFDHLFEDGEVFQLGNLPMRAMLTPGHTLGSITYVCGDAAFVNDTLMQPDSGTARADFPGGSTSELWQSIQTILSLPAQTRLFVGHDYGSDNRDEPAWEASVRTHRDKNIHVKEGTRKEDWINIRDEKDSGLSLPDRMLAALQVNLRAGQLPEKESDGCHYLKMPVNKF